MALWAVVGEEDLVLDLDEPFLERLLLVEPPIPVSKLSEFLLMAPMEKAGSEATRGMDWSSAILAASA